MQASPQPERERVQGSRAQVWAEPEWQVRVREQRVARQASEPARRALELARLGRERAWRVREPEPRALVELPEARREPGPGPRVQRAESLEALPGPQVSAREPQAPERPPARRAR